MDVLVLSPCSSKKQYDSVVDCAGVDARAREELVKEHPNAVAPAAEMYAGREHRHIRSAVEELREIATVDWYIISAGFGLLREDTPIPSYDCSFNELESVRGRVKRGGHDPGEFTNDETVRVLGREKYIPQDFQQALHNEYDLLFVVLGKSYLLSVADALSGIPDQTTAFAFASKGSKSLIGDCTWIPATETERQALGTTWLELRGKELAALVSKMDSTTLQQLRTRPALARELLDNY